MDIIDNDDHQHCLSLNITITTILPCFQEIPLKKVSGFGLTGFLLYFLPEKISFPSSYLPIFGGKVDITSGTNLLSRLHHHHHHQHHHHHHHRHHGCHNHQHHYGQIISEISSPQQTNLANLVKATLGS